jgi:PAS domain S-box-containing protein
MARTSGRTADVERRDPAVTAAAHLFAGPGAMRERCRALDWAATPLGPVETWPVSLRTTVATLLAARHPMILFWGPERVQVYNDAYVPTLGGADRHPAALGMRAADCWTGAVWAIVGPQLDAVVGTGEATWHEDQYVPLPRHGRVEDTYWTYSYGPAYDDAGRVAGVLVVTQETTARVLAERERQTREAASAAERERLRALILQAPMPMALLEGPEHRYALVNDAYREVSGRERDVAGHTVREAFPEVAGQGIYERFDRVYATGQPWVGRETPVRYDRGGAGVEDAWFDLRYEPVRDGDGRVTGILNTAVDVTTEVRARHEVERLLAESERARAALEAANAQLRDQQLELELANQQLQEQAAELEMQDEELQATAAHLEEKTEEAERARRAAEAARARATGILEAMSDGYFALDAEFRIVAVNAAMERNVGLTRDVLLGRVFWEVFPATVGTAYERHYRAAATEGRRRTSPTRTTTGGSRWCRRRTSTRSRAAASPCSGATSRRACGPRRSASGCSPRASRRAPRPRRRGRRIRRVSGSSARSPTPSRRSPGRPSPTGISTGTTRAGTSTPAPRPRRWRVGGGRPCTTRPSCPGSWTAGATGSRPASRWR